MWSRGDQIVLRYGPSERLVWVGGVTVVEDSDACIALYLAAGTPILVPVHLDDSEIPRAIPYEERHGLEWRLGEGVWHSTNRLLIARPGAAHAFSAFWRAEDWTFLAWYVDLQAPFRRTDDGFASEDYVLDIVAPPDGPWYWKDEDEFAAAQSVGRFTAEQAAAIRAEGEAVVATIEARAWPMDADWERWRPDPAWPIPELLNQLGS
jgi:hypothetical protein